MLCLPSDKPSIAVIEELHVNVNVEDFVILNTFLGPKIIIMGYKFIKLVYTASNAMQSLHATSWKVPFCDFILLKNFSCAQCARMIQCVFAGTEGGYILFHDERKLDVCVSYLLYPVFLQEPVPPPPPQPTPYDNCCEPFSSCYSAGYKIANKTQL